MPASFMAFIELYGDSDYYDQWPFMVWVSRVTRNGKIFEEYIANTSYLIG